MNIVLYLAAAFSAYLAVAALSGRTTTSIYGIEPGYLFMSKIKKDDPNRKLYMTTQFITNLLIGLVCLGIGLYLDEKIALSKPVMTWSAVGCVIIMLVMSFIYSVKIKRSGS